MSRTDFVPNTLPDSSAFLGAEYSGCRTKVLPHLSLTPGLGGCLQSHHSPISRSSSGGGESMRTGSGRKNRICTFHLCAEDALFPKEVGCGGDPNLAEAYS